MTVVVSLDTESGIVRRYAVGAVTPTHIAALASDPDDAEKTRYVLDRFRIAPDPALGVRRAPPRTYADAVAEQIAAREKKAG